ncbi:hypothetical protein Dimus_006243 [Dionaea muscipula]
MGKDSGSWLHLWQLDGQLHDAKPSKFSPFNLEGTDICSPPPCVRKVSVAGELPAFGTSELPRTMADQVKPRPHGWFYGFPQFRRGLSSIPDVILNENLLTKKIAADVPETREFLNMGSRPSAKKFLVFDQTGDKTTLIYSSGFDTPVHCHASPNPKPANGCTLNGEDVGTRAHAHDDSDPVLTGEDSKSSDHNAIDEDTDEIDALLYSGDEDDCSEDDEETSTGHSPSTMTAYHKEEWPTKGKEEVASSALPSKRMKLSEENCVTPHLLDTACSAKPLRLSEYEDDAESTCAEGAAAKFGDTACLSGNKRQRKERIRETVNILQRIIPGGRGKDPVVVLDEAVHYLRSLKLKAKSLGLMSL